MSYNFTGTLLNSSGTPLSGATISLQNGSLVSSTDASGNFTLNNVYPGVYNLDITHEGKTYKGNLTVEEGDNNFMESLGTTFVADAATNIFNVASSYKTTVSKILEANNFKTYSNAATFTSDATYNLRSTYKFTGGYDANVVGLKITLDSDNNNYTISL